MPSQKTYLWVFNSTARPMRVTVTDIENHDWDGVSRPDHNFNDVVIPPGGDRKEREEINLLATSNMFNLHFKLDNGYETVVRIDQRDAYNGDSIAKIQRDESSNYVVVVHPTTQCNTTKVTLTGPPE